MDIVATDLATGKAVDERLLAYVRGRGEIIMILTGTEERQAILKLWDQHLEQQAGG